ncbi:MAG: glycerophosphodiester phosphodiesterase [Defluviitaleaceae bacterium]|nr:glycerophosphodiester phosphodiesterase [Defluviitaleaceae bacterium]
MDKPNKSHKPLVLAHRGFSGKFPENSRRAFMEAVAITGCGGFEVDVNLSADNEPVIIHDATLDRTTSGSGPIKAATFKELRKLDVGSWMDPQFAGEQIMHLDELLELAIQYNQVLNIELKTYPVIYPGIEKIVIDRICKAGASDRVFLSSFNHLSMKLCKEINPGIKAGLLYMQPFINAEEYAAGYALHPEHNLLALEPDLVSRAHSQGLAVHTWTANTDEAMRRCISSNVDSIITNYPDKLVEILQG